MAIMVVTGHQGKYIDEEDFVKYLSYTRNWIPPDYARRLFKTCVAANLLKKEGDKYTPNFEFKGALPLDFKVTKKFVDEHTITADLFTEMLDYISKARDTHRKNVLIEINRIKKDAVYINVEVAALIYCKMYGIKFKDYLEKVRQKLVV